MTDIKKHILGFLGGTARAPAPDTYYADESALLRAYEESENGCITKEELSTGILTDCTDYYFETLSAYKALRADMQKMPEGSGLAEQLQLVEGRISEFNSYIELLDRLEDLKSAFSGLNDAVRRYKIADEKFLDALISLEITSFDQNDPDLMNIGEILPAIEKVSSPTPNNEGAKKRREKKEGNGGDYWNTPCIKYPLILKGYKILSNFFGVMPILVMRERKKGDLYVRSDDRDQTGEKRSLTTGES
jgi:hypothetical protein